MITGYDHLLFLVGVIFFLYRPKLVVQYVTLFAVGHSITLLVGVLGNIPVNAYIIDTIIGLSIVYKAFENIDGFKQLFGFEPNTKIAVFIFGLFHGIIFLPVVLSWIGSTSNKTTISELGLNGSNSDIESRDKQRNSDVATVNQKYIPPYNEIVLLINLFF